MGKRWAEIPGYEGLYSASTAGEIRSDVRRGRWPKGRLLQGRVNTTGHRQVALVDADGQRREKLVHRLVLLAFRGPCPKGLEGCHGNGSKLDNRLANLRWDTREANLDDRLKHGQTRIPRNVGEDHGRAVLDAAMVERMRGAKRSGQTFQAIADAEGVAKRTAFDAIKGRTWAHLPGAVT